jgi:surface polysaccharide O-acyltransferase-like enzyme
MLQQAQAPSQSHSVTNKPGYDIMIDGIRVIATFLVIAVHVSGKGFPLINERHWWAVNFWESLSHVSVPLFFMLTGTLLLPKTHTISSIWNRVWRVAIPLFAWSLLYLLWKRVPGENSEGWILNILKNPVEGHLWYLYTLIPIYLFVPILAAFYQSSTFKMQLFLLAFWLIGACIIPATYVITKEGYLGLNFSIFQIYPGYVLAGAAFYSKFKPNTTTKIVSILVWAVCTVLSAYYTWSLSISHKEMYVIFYEYFSPFLFVGSIASLVFFKAAFSSLTNSDSIVFRIIKGLAPLTFGVYLLHPMVIWTLDLQGYDYRFLNPWIAVPVLVSAVFAISSALIFAIQKVPVLKILAPR